MSLSDLASLGSFISGVAVLISLVFLYFQLRQVTAQIRQAERNQRATISAARATRATDAMLTLCEPSMADAYFKASSGAADMTITQWQQANALARSAFVNAEETFSQHRNGLMEENAWRAFVTFFSDTTANPAVRLIWRRIGRPAASPEFATFVDKLIAETPLRKLPPAEVALAAWRAEFDALLQAESPAGVG